MTSFQTNDVTLLPWITACCCLTLATRKRKQQEHWKTRKNYNNFRNISFLIIHLKMSASLENRSSLRKLDFPNSTQEALSRLYATFSAFSGASTSISMPPKETEIILVKTIASDSGSEFHINLIICQINVN